MKQLPYLSKEFIDRATAIFGPAPILSSEAPESFDLLFESLASCLQARDFFELMLIRHYAVEAWRVNRAIRHGTVAIERRYQEGERQKLQRARLQHAQNRDETREYIRSHTPADIAALAALEEEVMLSDDMEEMFKRKATEHDHNIAFERTMVFQEQLDKLIASATRRRDDAFEQLELYRIGLGAKAQEIAGQLLEAKAQEITPTRIEGPSLAPSNEGAITGEHDSNRPTIEGRPMKTVAMVSARHGNEEAK